MPGNMYHKKVRVAAYIDPEVYEGLKKERSKTRETESGIIASILECFVKESAKMEAEKASN